LVAQGDWAGISRLAQEATQRAATLPPGDSVRPV
jgi:hypothetical protein